MKKFTLGLLIALTGVYSASARQITSDEALSVASDFMGSSELKRAKSTNSALRPVKAPGMDVSPYYIFNRGENEGFVIISGDDRAPKILGYSDKGTFESKNLPPQLKDMMEQWTAQMRQLPESVSQHQSWDNAMETRAGEGVLMETAEWGQGYPYNLKCPVFEGEQAMTGCTATAMAIVMKYHNWPETTQGLPYTNYNHNDQTIDYSSQSIDWTSLDGDKDSDAFKTTASDLNYMVGVAIDTYYNSVESVADIWPIGHRMMEHFKYSPECQFIERKVFDNDKWHEILKDQLNGGYPVIYNGNGGEYSVGHAYVIDGYSYDGLYHVNWGWDGACNGYYSIDALIPDDRDFSQNAGMTINIIPDRSGKKYSRAFIPNAEVYLDYLKRYNNYNFSKPDITPAEPMSFIPPYITIMSDFEGFFGIAIVDKDGKIVSKLFDDDMSNLPNYDWQNLQRVQTINGCKNPGCRPYWYGYEFSKLPEGHKYQLVCYDVEDPEWRIVTGGIVHPSNFGDSGLNSDLCRVNIHYDKSQPLLPIFFALPKLHIADGEDQYKVLRGYDIGFSIFTSGGDIEYSVKSESNNTEVEPIYVTNKDKNEYFLTLSVFEDVNDIYVGWNKYDNNRHDKEFEPTVITEQDRLVYEVSNGEFASLIGYDKVEDDYIVIPESIRFNDKDYAVKSISEAAFSNCEGLKHISLPKSLDLVGRFGLSLIPDLESISVSGLVEFGWYSVNWSNSLKNVYLLSTNSYDSNFDNIYTYYKSYFEYEKRNLNFYIQDITPERPKLENGFIYVPGKGSDHYEGDEIEMWSYAIDRNLNKIKIEPQIDEISIRSVDVNGKTVTPDENCIYEVPSTDDMEVKVNYILNDRQEMTTIYDAAYNKEVPDQSLTQGVNGINSSNENISIFTLDGVVVSNYANESTVKSLTPGVYIIRLGNEMKKLVIR